MDNIEIIRDKIPGVELLAQLAEEAAELSQAALKLRRAIDGTSPTPLSQFDATLNLLEEVADVMLCLRVLDMDPLDKQNEGQYHTIISTKLKRWVNRLQNWEAEKNGE